LSSEQHVIQDHWLSKAVYAIAGYHRDGFLEAFSKDNPHFLHEKKTDPVRYAAEWNDAAWKEMNIPQHIERAGLNIDGVIWFRRSFDLTASQGGKRATLSLGPVDDSDEVWVNGQRIGGTLRRNFEKRVYQIPAGILKTGNNVIAVRVEDHGGNGGIYG